MKKAKKYLKDLKTWSREDATNKLFIAASLILLVFSVSLIVDTRDEVDFTSRNISVIDGDTLDATVNDSTVRVRLLGIDAPETYRKNNPEEYGLKNTNDNRRCLRRWGEKATEYAVDFTDERIEITTDEKSSNYGEYGRLLAYVERSNKSLNRELLKQGLARVYESEFSRIGEYQRIEEEAMKENLGIWSC